MKELLFNCPYCYRSLIEHDRAYFYCQKCNHYFCNSQIACSVCYSPIVTYLYKYRFCSNWNCPSFFKFYRCKLNLDHICESCKREVVDFDKVVVNYQNMCGLYKKETKNLKMKIMNNRMLTKIDFQSNNILTKVLEKYQNINNEVTDGNILL